MNDGPYTYYKTEVFLTFINKKLIQQVTELDRG